MVRKSIVVLFENMWRAMMAPFRFIKSPAVQAVSLHPEAEAHAR